MKPLPLDLIKMSGVDAIQFQPMSLSPILLVGVRVYMCVCLNECHSLSWEWDAVFPWELHTKKNLDAFNNQSEGN